jgi:hypothetical protein
MGKPTNIEQYAPPLLLSLSGVNKDRADSDSLNRYRNQVRDGYGALSGMGSFNHQQMLHAVDLWERGAPAADWWRGYFLQQLGKQKPQDGQELMGFFAGSEPFGPSYEPFRWGSVLAVRLWARRNQGQADDLLDLTAGYANVVCTLCALGAVPFPTGAYFNAKNRRFPYTGPYVSPVGERSNEHSTSDLCPLFASSVGWKYQLLNEPGWPVEMAGALDGDLGVDPTLAAALRQYVQGNPGPIEPLAEALQGITVRGEQHFIRWPAGRLVYKPQRTNGNTPCYLYDWLPFGDETVSATLVYPWPSGRGDNVRGAGACWIDAQRNISVQTQYADLCPPPFALPQDDPVSVVTMGPNGLLTGQSLDLLVVTEPPQGDGDGTPPQE